MAACMDSVMGELHTITRLGYLHIATLRADMDVSSPLSQLYILNKL